MGPRPAEDATAGKVKREYIKGLIRYIGSRFSRARPAPVEKAKRKAIESGKVTECKHCGTKHPMYANGTICFMAFFYIWERDLLEMARREQGWRKLANGLGFKDAKIDAPWTFPDEGRLIPYQRVKDGKFLTK